MKTAQSAAVQWSAAIFIGNRLVGKSLSKAPATLDSDDLKLSFCNMQKVFRHLAINIFQTVGTRWKISLSIPPKRDNQSLVVPFQRGD